MEKGEDVMKKEDLELIDYSIYFATKAHAGQKRKSEPDLDMIFHPFTVGMILQRAGANTNCPGCSQFPSPVAHRL